MTIKNIPEKIERGVELLTKFGLNENEAVIYAYLLSIGTESGASGIASGVGIHRQYIYLHIDGLIERGLVEVVQHGKHRRYKAISADQIKKIAKRKVFEAEEVARELYRFSAIGVEQDFDVYSGDIQVRKYEEDFFHFLRRGETQYVISGASQNFIAYFGKDYERLSLLGKKKSLATYYIGGSHEREYLAYARKINSHFQYRILDGMPHGVTSTVVRHNSVILYSLAKPPLVYVINSEIIAGEYRTYFDMLWRVAKKYEE